MLYDWIILLNLLNLNGNMYEVELTAQAPESDRCGREPQPSVY